MQRSALRIAIVILLGVVANGQQPSTPADGVVKEGVYSNSFFGFSVAYPTEWVVHGDATNTRLMEVGKERTVSSGALSASATEVILKNTYQLLTTFRYPLGTAGLDLNSSFMLIAENVSHAPGIVNGRDYINNVRPLMLKLGSKVVQDEPVELVFSGRKFFRLDSVTQANGVSVNQAMIIGIIKGYALAFVITAKDQQAVDEAAKAIDTLKFTDPLTSSPKP